MLPSMSLDFINPAWTVPLVASIVGVIAAGLAALMNTNGAALTAERSRVRDEFRDVRTQVARLLAAQEGTTIDGYSGIPHELLAEAKQQSILSFFERFVTQNHETRSALAGLNLDNRTIDDIINKGGAKLDPDDLRLVLTELKTEEVRQLRKLDRKWLPDRTLGSRSSQGDFRGA